MRRCARCSPLIPGTSRTEGRGEMEPHNTAPYRELPSAQVMSLRPYQTAALEAVRSAYKDGHRSALVVMPTGTGKTVLFAEIARLAKGPVLVLAHRQELVAVA
ncbi:MAG: DEAD/DEAH box helicase family protein [Planctomycetota bacterium]